MEGVPSPLQIGSPITGRGPFEHNVPTALRVGSPTVGAASSHARPALTRKKTSGSDRLSQLFPSRPASIASISPPVTTTASRRASYPSPLVPAAEPSYRIPRAPAPPLFTDDTSYDPVVSTFSYQGASPRPQSKSGTKKLLSRLTSLRRGNSKGSSYNRLEDEELGESRARLGGVQETDEAVGYDLSGFEGLPMKNFEPQTRMTSGADAQERERDLNEAGHAAEFERLEAQLGAGMTTILQKPFTHTPTRPLELRAVGHQRILSAPDFTHAQAQNAQKEANEKGGIVAVADIPIDISDFAAGDNFDRRSTITSETGLAKGAETSYFFPEGIIS